MDVNGKAPMFAESKTRYEAWLRDRLGEDFVANDLARKDELIRENAFVFLRGTYWRWAETILELCPELGDAPQVLGVGDIHLENFGTWRDVEGRLIWGVNDFDEAATMPYTVDLVRLVASAYLGGDDGKGAVERIGKSVLRGYAAGLAGPEAIVLDRDWQWLRQQVVVAEERREKFWKKIDQRTTEPAPDRFRQALADAMPVSGLDFDTSRRVAGTGSLGRARWLAVADWRGGVAVREAKCLVTSGWALARGEPDAPTRTGEIAGGRYRVPDPWYQLKGSLAVRRLSPNNRKIEADKRGAFLLKAELHEAMGRELVNVHFGTADDATVAAVVSDFGKRPTGWLAKSALIAANAVLADFKSFKKSQAAKKEKEKV